MGGFSLIHWIILGLFLLLLFGGNRFSNMMKDVAKGMKSFKEGMADENEKARPAEPRQLPREQRPIDITPTAPPPAEPVAPPPPPSGDETPRG